jgi:hypothetical protein
MYTTLADYIGHVQEIKQALKYQERRSTLIQPDSIPDYMNKSFDWVGFDFDRTLATYTKWSGPAVLGQPITPMVDLLLETKKHTNVKIFTARIWPVLELIPNVRTIWDPRHKTMPERTTGAADACVALQKWCEQHLGFIPNLTCIKDIHCTRLYDDIAVQVIPNTGKIVQHAA